jgi:ketosteroid isomerase-like protein
LRADSGGFGPTDNTQVAAVDQLLADFHGSLSYGGNIDAMMSLWTDDSSLTLNGLTHVGKAAIQTFFQTSGYFLNKWVSLAPEYKTTVNLHGNTAEVSTQCVAVDLSTTPPVVRSVIQVNAVVVKHGDTWMFVSMNNTSGAPL